MAAKSTAVDSADADEASVDLPLAPLVQSGTNPEGGVDVLVDCEKTMTPDSDDVPYEGDVHGTPYTNPAHPLGARKKQKDITEGRMGADTVGTGSDPCEGRVDPGVLNGHPIAVEGSGVGQSAQDFNELKLTKQQCCFASKTCLHIVEQGGGPQGVPVEASASQLVTVPHQCRSKGRSRGQVGQVILHNKTRIAGMIWDNFKPAPQPYLRYVFMPLLETTEGHWLLLVADVHERCFLVYDSLRSPADKKGWEFVESARIALVLAFLRSTTYADAAQWEVVTPECPEQRKYA
ncbi:hypothetical protein Cgig2_005951 [Carnegiea gigantea]|uniref:Ubiquitin-like protease family profile domain-containing protein n=1 Tax=Carnegiea gigantea TaxID=171969 RepID=A0A9Q1KKC3_9CARY|nr:hypothetical protein Cgig2_005951 [Carnegiea gigantea]